MKNKKGLSEIVVTLIIILLSLVSIAVVWVVVNKLVNENQYEFKITEKVCNNETSLISTTLISSEKIIINKTFKLHNYRKVYYFSEFENEIQDTYTEDYKVEVSKFINSTYFDLETGEIKEYNYLLSDFETPIKLVKNEEIGFIYKEILDISPENFFGKEITLEFEVWHNKYNYSYETKEFCEEKEVDEINFSTEGKIKFCFCFNDTGNCRCQNDIISVSKQYLQEHPEWLDENCECIAFVRTYACVNPQTDEKIECGEQDKESNLGKCLKYSYGNYTVEVKYG